MWTKNGAETLPPVLKRISEVIPSEFVHKRIIVDDRSTDNTRKIAESFGWTVIFNEGKGISDGANTALKHVTSEYFISFEQDLLLAYDWWEKIPQHLLNPKVAVASGIRLPSPLPLRKLEEYCVENFHRRKAGFSTYGKSFDNTIYKTRIIRSIGGFPHLSISVGVDDVLAYQIHLKGLEWRVDYTVKSIHLRHGIRDELAHLHWRSSHVYALNKIIPDLYKQPNLKRTILRDFFCPFRGLEIAIKQKAPEMVYIYPLTRFAALKGILDGRKSPMTYPLIKQHNPEVNLEHSS
jgi:glycosyltransferase involved in cell wall biosynthesis